MSTEIGVDYSTHDNGQGLCRSGDKAGPGPGRPPRPSLPPCARLPINRCNLPAVILGSVTFQQHPAPLKLDGVEELHRDLFARLARLDRPHHRAQVFADYMTVVFRLEHLDEAGLSPGRARGRAKANWMRTLRGWAFDADGREAAALKGWVESRFGLVPRHHGVPLRDPADPAYLRYQEMRARGLYGTNALEAQLDLVYAYCQYEFARQWPERSHLRLFRGVNRLDAYELLADLGGDRRVVLLNSVSSFSTDRNRAGEFGDTILAANVPLAKVLFHCRLLPGVLKGEGEYLVIGGAYEVGFGTF